MLGLSATRQQASTTGRLRAKALLLHHLLRQVALQRQNHPVSRAAGLVILGLALALHTPRFARISCNVSKDLRATSKVLSATRSASSRPSSPAFSLSSWSTWISWWWSGCRMSTPKRRYHLTCCWRLQSSEDPNAMHLLCLPSPLPRYHVHLPSGSRAYRDPDNWYEK